MAEDQLRSIIDGVRQRLQAELEAHLGSLAETHEHALESVRRAAAVEAEQQWTSRLDEAREEWNTRLQSEVAAARAEVERTMSAESTSARLEAEQAAADAAACARRELEEAVNAERTRALADLERAQAERERAHADQERARAELERAQADRERAQENRERLQVDLERAHAELAGVGADRARAQEDRERTHADLERAHAELAGVGADRTRAQEDRERLQADLGRAHAELAGVEADRERTQADLERAHAELRNVHADLARAQAEIQSGQEDLGRALGELEGAQAQFEAARTQADEIRARADRGLAEARAAFDAERAAAAEAVVAVEQNPSSSGGRSGLLDAIRAIDESSSLSAALAAVVRGAALESPRVALFIVNGRTLEEWPVEGVPPVDSGPIRSDGREAGFLAEVLRSGEAQSIDGTNGSQAPTFARLSAGRGAIAVPFVLGGRPVAVLYADEGTDGQALTSWRDTVQILGRHGSAFIAYLTALRTAQALRLMGGAPDVSDPFLTTDTGGTEDEAQGARRYARLLVSEIKLYNEGAVRTGRERRDLLQRLKPEIDRARRLYDERIAPSIRARDLYFHQELVQTLADGDQTLLG